MIDGIMNIYKEPGYTSFDVVAKMRGILKQKKIGHTGTLDPDAEGVLVLCLGNATKLCEMLTDKDKEYIATLQLGITTDTEDTSGTVLSQSPVNVSESEVRETILSFVGKQKQIPPMYSAIKKDGKKLYELAREGIVIEREPRDIEVFHIDIISMDLPFVKFSVCCSKGTYIRSLCRDIGEKLGCGGAMSHLLRNRVSQFSAEDALKLSDVEMMRDEGRISECVYPIPSLFPSYPIIQIRSQAEKYLMNGNPLTLNSFVEMDTAKVFEGMRIFVCNQEQEIKGLYIYQDKKQMFVPDKMFLS